MTVLLAKRAVAQLGRRSVTEEAPDFLAPEAELALAWSHPKVRPALSIALQLDRRLARIVSRTSEPVLGQMRLTWWREALGKPPTERPLGDAVLEAIGEHWKSTVQIYGENRQLALGAIARSDGWIVTKSSEIPDKSIEVRLQDGTKLPGVVKIRRPELDLALIKVDRAELPAIRWSNDTQVPLGGWIASADARSLPLALGVVSVEKRNIQKQRPLLGIQLSSFHQGPLVENVVVGSGADRAGIREGDVIIKIDGKEVQTRQEVLNLLMSFQAGRKITIDVNRDSKSIAFEAQMMDLTNLMLDPTELEVNGSISARSTGFGDVIEHDSVLAPQHCGGPIVDVNGNVVGLNIARAGRVSCYALRSKVVSKAIEEMLQTA